MLHHGKTYFEIKAIQLEFERLLQKKYAGKGNSLAKVLPWPAQGRSCSGLDFGRRMGRLVDRMQPWLLAQQKTPQLLLRGLKKKGQALLIAVSGVWEAAEAVCDRGRRSHVWEDGGPAEAAGGDDGRCRRSKEWSRR